MKPVRWTDNQEHPTPWRAGRSVHRTIYDANEVLIGFMDTAELAAAVIEAVNGEADKKYDCTVEEFETWCDQLGDRLMEYEPRVCDSVACDLDKRSMQIDIYGRQVKRLLEQLTLLAEYKASTEAAKRRAQDPDFMAGIRADTEARDRELLRRRTITDDAAEG